MQAPPEGLVLKPEYRGQLVGPPPDPRCYTKYVGIHSKTIMRTKMRDIVLRLAWRKFDGQPDAAVAYFRARMEKYEEQLESRFRKGYLRYCKRSWRKYYTLE